MVFKMICRLRRRRRIRPRSECGGCNNKQDRSEDTTEAGGERVSLSSRQLPNAGQCESPDAGGADSGMPVLGSR